MGSSKRNNIFIFKAGKRRRVVILDMGKYAKNILDIFNTSQFQKLNKDPTKTMESKAQNILKKIMCKLTIDEQKQRYPSGSSPGSLCGTLLVPLLIIYNYSKNI